MRHAMRSIGTWGVLAVAALGHAGCATPQYGVERQITLLNGTHPVWAVAPAVNLSGEPHVDALLQADLVYQQLQSVNNLTVIPVNRVIEVYAALHIDRVQNQEQASLVCEQLGCDALVVPTTTLYDPYDPPRFGAALQLLTRVPDQQGNENIDPRELARRATPGETEHLPVNPHFIQVVGVYDAHDGSVRAGVAAYARGRHDPFGPLGADEYFVSMDRYCSFVYFTLVDQLIGRVTYEHPGPDHPRGTPVPVPPAVAGELLTAPRG